MAPVMRLAILGDGKVGHRLVAERQRGCSARGSDRGVVRLVRVNMAPTSSGLRSRFSISRVLGQTRLQERLVGRVFQQPAHQVSHAWQHGAIGGVNPDPVAAGDQCGLNHVAHAVQGLELEAGWANRRSLGGRDRMGQAANVVAAEGGAQLLMMLDQEPGAPLIHRVALPLPEEDRLGPAQPPRGQDLVVPVGPLD